MSQDGYWGTYASQHGSSIRKTAAALRLQRMSLYYHLHGERSLSPSTVHRLCRHWHISRRTLDRAIYKYIQLFATGSCGPTTHGRHPHCRGCPHLAAAAARQPSTPNQ